jgi:hypothetical protein
MHKTVMLMLNQFAPACIPQSLMGGGNAPVDKVSVSIRRLCHHMLLDTYGVSIPKLNPLFPLYQTLINGSPALEFISGSLGSHKEAKIAESMKLGKAFCRWFLAEHFQFVYFGHMDHLLNKAPLPQYGNARIVRVQPGDTPDYLCADSSGHLFLAEAKGRQEGSIRFQDTAFQKWRDQFLRINVVNAQAQVRRMKGYIVATRLKLETQAATASKIFAEDPESPGEEDLSNDELPGLHRMAIHGHYSGVFEILGLLLHSAALRDGFVLPREEPVVVGIWRCLIPKLDHLRFAGGFLPSETTRSESSDFRWWFDFYNIPRSFREFARDFRGTPFGWNPNLDVGQRMFFGLETQLFKHVLEETRQSSQAITEIEPLTVVAQDLPEQVSLLRDGTVLAPASFMRLEDVTVL